MEQGEKREFDASTIDNNELGDGYTEQSSRVGSVAKRKRIIGPSLPPSTTPEYHNEQETAESDSVSSDDDIGPALPSANTIPSEAQSSEETRHKSHEASVDEAQPRVKEMQRDEWMLKPPESTDWTTKVDPTKLRNRKFQSGRSANAVSEGIDTSWTEAPGEKLKRLQDEAMGVIAPSKPGRSSTARPKEVAEKRMQRHNDVSERKGTPYDKSQRQSRHSLKDDDPSMRAFNRETDMAISSRLSNAQRRELLNRASNFESRFTDARFL